MDGVLFGLTSDSPRGRLLETDCPDPGATAPGELHRKKSGAGDSLFARLNNTTTMPTLMKILL